MGRERITTDYHVVGGVSYCGHNRHHSGEVHEIRIDITGPLVNIAKEEFERKKQDLKFEFKIKTIYDLFFFKYLLADTNVMALGDTGFLWIVTKDGMWNRLNDSAEHSAKSLVRELIVCNKAFKSDAVIGTIAGQLMKEERFYKSMDSIPERCKVVEHSFSTGSCRLHYKYATELRKFGVGLILASQLITHFTDEILSNIAVKLCMKAENKVQARKNNTFFGAGENEIINLKQGEGIIISGKDKIKVKIVPTWERPIFSQS